jgi:cell division septation protein DedD
MARAKERVYQPEPDEAPPRPPRGGNSALGIAVGIFSVLASIGLIWAFMGGIGTVATIKPDVAAYKERGEGEAADALPAPADRVTYDVLEGQAEVARPLPPEALAKAAQAAAAADPPPVTNAPTAPVQPAPVQSAPANTATPVSGKVVVQLAALSTEAAGRGLWQRVQKASPAPEGAGLVIQPNAPTGATIYRVRVGPFADRDAATAYCGQIRAKSFDCQVVNP